MNVPEESVALGEGVADLLLNDLLNSRAYDLEEERLEDVEEQLVVGLLELDVQVLDVNSDLIQSDEVLAILLVGGASSNLEVEALAAQNNVHNTSVGDRGETLLLLDVVANITKISLDASGRDHDLVVMLVADLLATPAEVVVTAKLESIGHQIVALNAQVLDNNIDHRVRNLDARNGDVADILEESRQDDVGQVLDKMFLELGLAILVVAELLEQALGGETELLVLRILIKLLAEELDLVKNAVGVIAIAVTEQEAALVIELIPLLGAGRLKNVALGGEAFPVRL